MMASRSFLQFYNDPPTGQISIGAPGSTSTAPMSSQSPPDERRFPRRIIQDSQLCQTLLQFARNHLATSPAPPALFDGVYDFTRRVISRGTVGDETRNTLVFDRITEYVIEFVLQADQLPPNDIDVVPCETEGHIRPNLKVQRNRIDRVIVELKSIGAYDAHGPNIQDLARGQGTEIIPQTFEAGARSIIFKVRALHITYCLVEQF
jgi:hypothetical protein